MIAPILGSFFVLFLPLALLQLIPNFVAWVPYVMVLEVVGLGTTHFFITLALYLRAENLDYFRSSTRNVLVYLVAPLLIFVLIAAKEAGQLSLRFPEYAPYFLAFVRFCDFFHVGRQSAGMLQIWKRRMPLPSVLRIGEQVLFVGLACMQWQTFIFGGRFHAEKLSACLPALGLCGVFAALVAAHIAGAWSAQDKHARARWMPLVYLVLQATCAASAVYDTRLYLTALVMHYVEYHVIMLPRLFDAPLAPARAVNRMFSALRSRRWVFYAALTALVVAFELRSYAQASSLSTRFLVHIFDGVFLVHYFIEAFLWKFRNPFYRSTLAPLYFEAPVVVSESVPAPRRSVAGRGVAIASLALIAVLLGTQRWLGAAADSLQRHAIDPMHASNHLHWGVQLAEAGELAAARPHFVEAARRDPDDVQAKRFLQWVDAHLQR